MYTTLSRIAQATFIPITPAQIKFYHPHIAFSTSALVSDDLENEVSLVQDGDSVFYFNYGEDGVFYAQYDLAKTSSHKGDY